MEYRVIWSIDLDTKSREEAARLALEIQRDPDSIAGQFVVIDEHGDKREEWAENPPKFPHIPDPHSDARSPPVLGVHFLLTRSTERR